MGRKSRKVKSPVKQWGEKEMKKAINMHNKGVYSLRQIAQATGISHMTISRRFSGRGTIDATFVKTNSRRGLPPRLSEVDEQALVDYIETMNKCGFRVSWSTIVARAQEYKNEVFGQSWIDGFRKRHNISAKLVDTVTSERARSLNSARINTWCSKWDSFTRTHGITNASQVFNMDETGSMAREARYSTLVVNQGAANKVQAASSDRHHTSAVTVCADGSILPPFFIFSAEQRLPKNWSNEAPEGSQATCNPKGSMTIEAFGEYAQFIISHMRAVERAARSAASDGPPDNLQASQDPWLVLLCDNLEAHVVNEKALALLLAHRIILFTFPSNVTSVMQPLDVSIFKPWKQHEREIRTHLITLSKSSASTGRAYAAIVKDIITHLAEKPSLVQKAFETTGVWPVKKDVTDHLKAKNKLDTGDMEFIVNRPTPYLELKEYKDQIARLGVSPSKQKQAGIKRILELPTTTGKKKRRTSYGRSTEGGAANSTEAIMSIEKERTKQAAEKDEKDKQQMKKLQQAAPVINFMTTLGYIPKNKNKATKAELEDFNTKHNLGIVIKKKVKIEEVLAMFVQYIAALPAPTPT